jgi:hypothetical protein
MRHRPSEDQGAVHRELGKLPRTAPDGLVLQLGGPGQRPWLSVDDRCRPMRRHVGGAAGENDAAPSVLTTGSGPSLLTTCLVGKLRTSAAVRYSREGCGSLADAARDLHVLLADPRGTIEKGLVAGEVNDELGAGV